MRGFPIRTSSDHGSFANSPRLIAGYNVLLRLLVPRHPPCALKNFNKKDHYAESSNTQTTLTRRCRGVVEHLGCSRPLCSSQATDGPTDQTHLPTQPSQHPVRGTNQPCWRFAVIRWPVQRSTPPMRAVASGPNSAFINPHPNHNRRSNPQRRRTSRPQPVQTSQSMFHPEHHHQLERLVRGST